MALCKFGHVSLVNKIFQKLLKLEPWNLMNRLVVMSRWPDYAPSFEWNWLGILFCLHLSIRLFVRSSSFFCACHILRTLHARVLKFYIWVPNEKIADPYFVSCLACLLAHLSSAQDELLWSLFVRRPSVCSSVRASVRPSVRPLTFSNDFSSEAAEPILLKFHMEPP